MWRVVAACEAGASHLRTGTPCQDAFAVAQAGETLLLFAADGAGSAARADEGSRLAADAALEAARAELESGEPRDAEGWRALLERIVHAARGRLEEEAGELRDLSTTLLGVLWTPTHLAALQVGDGWIVIETMGSMAGAMRAPIPPIKGEYFNETIFLTSSGFAERARYEVLDAGEVSGVAVLTDGLEMVSMDLAEGTPHEPFFRPLFELARDPEEDPAAAERELGDFLRSERICARTDDDKTLLLAVRTGES
jgi:hypothetical protein